MTKDISIENFNYDLPEERIPLHPLAQRDRCKLLLLAPNHRIYHRIFRELPDLLPSGSLLVFNDTKVIHARLFFKKSSGATIELFLLEPVFPADYALNFQSRQDCLWKCLVGNSKKWKEGMIYNTLQVHDETVRIRAEREETGNDGTSIIHFYWNNPLFTFGQIVESLGQIPIPPYLNRSSEASDEEDYQTVYARVKGSVAAPTAGLHFTPEVLDDLKAHNIASEKVTLHVGAGTFRPVKTDKIGEHAMHSEPFTVTKDMVKTLIEWKQKGRPIVAVGTTSVRTLESLPFLFEALTSDNSHQKPVPYIGQWWSYEKEDFDTLSALENLCKWMQERNLESILASTSIMIAPGFKWRLVDGMVTNFHQPKSTLLLLVSSFLGGDMWRYIYEEALKNDYRFLSYGDACLFLRPRIY